MSRTIVTITSTTHCQLTSPSATAIQRHLATTRRPGWLQTRNCTERTQLRTSKQTKRLVKLRRCGRSTDPPNETQTTHRRAIWHALASITRPSFARAALDRSLAAADCTEFAFCNCSYRSDAWSTASGGSTLGPGRGHTPPLPPNCG